MYVIDTRMAFYEKSVHMTVNKERFGSFIYFEHGHFSFTNLKSNLL